MNFIESMRVKHGKKPGNMNEANNFFSSMPPGAFKEIGKQVSRAHSGIKKKRPQIKPGQKRLADRQARLRPLPFLEESNG